MFSGAALLHSFRCLKCESQTRKMFFEKVALKGHNAAVAQIFKKDDKTVFLFVFFFSRLWKTKSPFTAEGQHRQQRETRPWRQKTNPNFNEFRQGGKWKQAKQSHKKNPNKRDGMRHDCVAPCPTCYFRQRVNTTNTLPHIRLFCRSSCTANALFS